MITKTFKSTGCVSWVCSLCVVTWRVKSTKVNTIITGKNKLFLRREFFIYRTRGKVWKGNCAYTKKKRILWIIVVFTFIVDIAFCLFSFRDQDDLKLTKQPVGGSNDSHKIQISWLQLMKNEERTRPGKGGYMLKFTSGKVHRPVYFRSNLDTYGPHLSLKMCAFFENYMLFYKTGWWSL